MNYPGSFEPKGSHRSVNTQVTAHLQQDRMVIRLNLWKVKDGCSWEEVSPRSITKNSIQSFVNPSRASVNWPSPSELRACCFQINKATIVNPFSEIKAMPLVNKGTSHFLWLPKNLIEIPYKNPGALSTLSQQLNILKALFFQVILRMDVNSSASHYL